MKDDDDYPESFESKRHKEFPAENFDPKKPRVGRHGEESHSDDINYLYDVLTTNFPESRVMRKLRHYFTINGIDLDFIFDISFFKNFSLNFSLSSYRSKKFNNRVPDMVINLFSKRTWRSDIGEYVDNCRSLKIPVYVVYPPYHVAKEMYLPPFLRAYILQPNGHYQIEELGELTIEEENVNEDAFIDISQHLPFRIGLEKRTVLHETGNALYRLILIDPTRFKILPTEVEKANQSIEKSELRIQELKDRREKANQSIKKSELRIQELKDRREKAELKYHELKEKKNIKKKTER